MEGNTTDFNNVALLISAGAAAISAISALLAFLFLRKLSRRDMVDILKIEILRVVSSVQGREIWIKHHRRYLMHTGGHSGPTARTLVELLGRKYKKEKWMILVLVAIEELRKEGYRDLLGG